MGLINSDVSFVLQLLTTANERVLSIYDAPLFRILDAPAVLCRGRRLGYLLQLPPSALPRPYVHIFVKGYVGIILFSSNFICIDLVNLMTSSVQAS